jgi:hypothetical protein
MKPLAIKVNASGSWANLLTCPPARLAEVQEACLVLARHHLGSVSFKALDGDTGAVVLQLISPPKPGQPFGWHAPKPV